jgi:glutamate dehydrogenase (NAD(P)+)
MVVALQALDVLGYDNAITKILLTPARQVTVELIITNDKGKPESFSGFRVQHNNSRGPFKGGLRYHPQVDMDDVKRYEHTLVVSHRSAAC